MLVLLYPTQGVDIASKEALFAIVERARAGGAGVLIVSDELDELSVCDRVLVIFKGRLDGRVRRRLEQRGTGGGDRGDRTSVTEPAALTRCRTSRDRAAARRLGLLGLRELTLVPVIVLVIVIGAFASDAFLTTDNFLNILQQSSELSVAGDRRDA